MANRTFEKKTNEIQLPDDLNYTFAFLSVL